MYSDIKQVRKGDFFTLDGQEYEGLYYVDMESNIAYSYNPNSKLRQVLVPKSIHTTEMIRPLIKTKVGRTEIPIPFTPTPNSTDYKRGYIYRHFMQKRNAPMSTITEISREQMDKISTQIYNSLTIKWVIGRSSQSIEDINRRYLNEAESKFPGIEKFLENLAQYSY